MKLIHNKKRNTAFLYESLVAELTKTTLNGDKAKQEEIVLILKEFFHKSKVLHKEMKLYKEVSDLRGTTKKVAARVFEEVKKSREKLDDREIFNEQTKLINRINKALGPKTFDNFVPNYKNLASVYQIFNSTTPIKSKVILENVLIDEMCASPITETVEKPKVSKAVYKIFTNKFNEKYSSLLENQKTLLKLYIESVRDNGLELQSFINEELGDIKASIDSFSNTEEGKELQESLSKFKKEVDSFKGMLITEEVITKLLKMQALVGEIKNG